MTVVQNNFHRQLRRRTLLIICLLLLSVAAGAAEALSSPTVSAPTPQRATDAQIIEELKKNLDKLTAEDKFSGAVLVAKGDTVLFEQAYGYANHAFNARNRIDTKFNLGSMGKMFTAVSILQLVQEGRISVNDRLIKDLPDYPDKDIAAKITIHQLLTHTSGIPDFFNDKFQNAAKEQYRTLSSFLPLFTGQPLQFEPGTRWSYSNSGFIILGLIIEHVSGQSYRDYVREHVFKPAGMVNTENYDVDDDVPNMALGYTTMGAQPSGPRKINMFTGVARGGSAGGGYSTVEDLLRFSEALQSHKLLSKEFTDIMMTGKVQKQVDGETKYCYGIEETVTNGVRIVGHSGGAPGVSSNLDMYTDRGYTVVIMSNYDYGIRAVNPWLRSEFTGQ